MNEERSSTSDVVLRDLSLFALYFTLCTNPEIKPPSPSPMASSTSMATISASSSSSPFSPHSNSRNPRRRVPPITISTNPSHLDPLQLRDLLLSCNLSCDRFPLAGPCGRAEPVDARKLRRALAHSFVVVSVFCRAQFLDRDDERDGPGLGLGFEELFERALPVSGSDHRLVGFGRAVSDGGLTASIHDVVVVLQGMRFRGGLFGVYNNDVHSNRPQVLSRQYDSETRW
ncbi:hypothetical protein ACMD2_15387 [Ananas comosus]|uniref:Uncharacterized protein n=1 Tax=Ananas comosus TaxID=4615 RepID=A0A199UP33_ANACO|nr:hypothetical protein ACMD2_15387 [Ananas comosus]